MRPSSTRSFRAFASENDPAGSKVRDLMMNSSQPPLSFVQHPARPLWGRCIIVAERDGKVFLHCEDGEEHAIAATHKASLASVEVPSSEAPQVAAFILDKRTRAAAKAARKPKKNAVPKVRQTFESQLERFSAAFAGGFTGEAFVQKERAVKDAAIARAKELLSASLLSAPDAFANVAKFLGEANLMHPMESVVSFRGISAEDQPAFVSALSSLLHGSGDYAARFDAWVAAVRIGTGEGEARTIKRPSWPFTTIFAALLAPNEQVFIKPKTLQEQAAILNLPVNYQPLPSGSVYEQFRAVLSTVAERLRAAGQSPRDLWDVATFVQVSLAPAEAPAAPDAPADAPSA